MDLHTDFEREAPYISCFGASLFLLSNYSDLRQRSEIRHVEQRVGKAVCWECVTFCTAIAHRSGTGTGTSGTNCNLHLLAFVNGVLGTNMSGLSYPLTLVWLCFVTLIVVAAMFGGHELTHMLRRRLNVSLPRVEQSCNLTLLLTLSATIPGKSRGNVTSLRPRWL